MRTLADAGSFEARFRALLSGHTERRSNDGCVECVECVGCAQSTFCRESERLLRCHYCVRARSCSECSHCRDSRDLIGCHHCIECERCLGSSYLVRCVAVSASTYCFGCVGLSGKDFHILNEPYERTEYFRITRELLGAASATGGAARPSAGSGGALWTRPEERIEERIEEPRYAHRDLLERRPWSIER